MLRFLLMAAPPPSSAPNQASTQYRAPDRQQWQDSARGIAIILVVHGHVLLGLMAAGVIADAGAARFWGYAIYTFHMPLFFFLAGLNAVRSLRRGAGQFLRSKIWTIIYPYFLWSFLQGIVQIVMSRSTNETVRFENLADILWRPIGQFWFLYALMMCHIVAALLPRRPAVLIVAGVATFSVALFLPVNVWAAAMHQFLFYALGMSLAGFLSRWQPPRLLPIATAAVWLLFCAAVFLGASLDPRADWLTALPAALLGIAGMIGLCMTMPSGLARIFRPVGAMSMSIYVMHVVAGSGTRVGLGVLGLPADPTLHLVAGTVIGVGAPMIAHWVLERLGMLSHLGLAPVEWALPVRIPAALRKRRALVGWPQRVAARLSGR